MGNKEREAQHAKYRLNIGREFGSRFKNEMEYLLEGDFVESLYQKIYQRLEVEVRKMNTPTLARIIEATPKPGAGLMPTPLMLPRRRFSSLEGHAFIELSGRDYLEVLAACAITGAVHDYWKTLKWKLKGKDRECDRYYFFPGEYSSKAEVETAADRELQLIKARTGKGVLPDRVYVIQPDGVEYHYVTKEPV